MTGSANVGDSRSKSANIFVNQARYGFEALWIAIDSCDLAPGSNARRTIKLSLEGKIKVLRLNASRSLGSPSCSITAEPMGILDNIGGVIRNEPGNKIRSPVTCDGDRSQ